MKKRGPQGTGEFYSFIERKRLGRPLALQNYFFGGSGTNTEVVRWYSR